MTYLTALKCEKFVSANGELINCSKNAITWWLNQIFIFLSSDGRLKYSLPMHCIVIIFESEGRVFEKWLGVNLVAILL